MESSPDDVEHASSPKEIDELSDKPLDEEGGGPSPDELDTDDYES